MRKHIKKNELGLEADFEPAEAFHFAGFYQRYLQAQIQRANGAPLSRRSPPRSKSVAEDRKTKLMDS